MILQSARIELLFALRNRDREQIAARAFADEAAETFETRIRGAEVHIQARNGTASRATVVAFICSAETFVPQFWSQTYVIFEPVPAIRSLTPQAKPG